MSATRQTIVQLLSNMSDGKEIRSYLQRFSAVDQSRFAVIKIGGAILRDQLEETASALAFLHTVGLTPIVLHGGGPQLDEALQKKGVETPKADGLRVTSAAALDVAREVFAKVNISLVEAVRAQGVAAHSLISGAIEANYLDKEKLGFVGEPAEVRLELIRSAAQSGAIPILSCLGIAEGGQLLNINGDSATRALVHALQPMKIIFLSGVGGLLDAQNKIIHSINLASDYDTLMVESWVSGGMRFKLEEIKKLLDDAPLSTSVSITTPSGLVRELFTHGGAGTLVRKGERINEAHSKNDIDQTKIESLVENAFQRQLKPDWWAGLDLHEAYVSESNRAGALLSKVDDFIYLDKFAVLDDARGEGLGRTVWRRLANNNPVFFWRSKTANGFNAFYHDAAAGSVKKGPWTIFWIGESSFDQIARIVDRISTLPASFEEDDNE